MTRQNVPMRSYDLVLKIGGKDYSADLSRVTIISSLLTPYQTFVLEFMQDSTETIMDDFYGQDSSFLTIKQLNQSIGTESFTLELMPLNTDLSLYPVTDNIMGQQKPKDSNTVYCVPKIAYKIMSCFLNEIYFAKPLYEIFDSLVTKAGGKIVLNEKNLNRELINQVLVPPTTLYKSLKYLDEEFSLYDNKASLIGYCDIYGKVYCFDMQTQMKNKEAFTIYQLSNSNNTKVIQNSSNGDCFYTYEKVMTSYNATAKASVIGNKISCVLKPSDDLYFVQSKTIKDICLDSGLNDKNSKLYLHDGCKDRKTYNIEKTGFNTNESSAFSSIYRQLATLSPVTIMLDRNLVLSSLMKIGNPVNFKTNNPNFLKLNGRMLLKSSEITLTKKAEWQAVCKINLIRSNRTN